MIFTEPGDKVGLANPTISDDDDLDHEVVFLIFFFRMFHL